MTFDELWQTLPIPFGYEHMDELDKRRWQALVEAAFRKGLFDGTHKSASARVNDSRRISDLESAVAEIRASILAVEKIEHPIDKADTILALKTELRYISCALDDPRVDVTPFGYEHMMTASEVIKGLRSALKVIHTWASFPESFDFEQTKRLCMSALGREQ